MLLALRDLIVGPVCLDITIAPRVLTVDPEPMLSSKHKLICLALDVRRRAGAAVATISHWATHVYSRAMVDALEQL